MDPSSKYRAAGGHLISAMVGLVAIVLGARWVRAGGDLVAIPHTLVVLSLVVLTPLARQRGWSSRGEFVDRHMVAASRFLTSLGLAAAVLIGLPAAVSWLLPAGTALWSNIMVLPYLGAVVIPVTWAFFAVRAAVMAIRGIETPFPQWMVPEVVSPH